ncbi:MAG TPA: COP23 domain-containing protein [Trichocoleus sp.]
MVSSIRIVGYFALVGGLGLLTIPLSGLPGLAQSSTPTSSEAPASTSTPTSSGEGQSSDSGSNTATSDRRFACQVQNGQHTVMYLPQSQPDSGYPWAIPEDMGSAWPAERRCQEISRRLETYRPDGLVEMQTGVENGYNTVCVTTEKVPGCRIVFTVPPGQDPRATRDRVFNNLTIADRGDATQGVNTFTEGGSPILDQLGNILNLPGSGRANPASGLAGINLKPFLAPSDGGTGTRLAPSNAPAGRPLNPDLFR